MMTIQTTIIKNTSIALIDSPSICISDVGSALDFLMTVQYQTGCHAIIINKEAVAEDFFNLSTKLAGEILQKLVTYRFRLAIVGDYSHYTSKALKDFIYESNQGKTAYFVETQKDALALLAKA